MSRIRVNRAALVFIFLAVLSCIAWKMQENNLFARKAVGLVSRMVYLNYSACGRCNRSWALVDEHVTPVDFSTGGHGCFPLCETCWSELTIEERLPYYHELFLYWKSIGSDKTQEDWENMRIAVEMGK